jgi:CDP-2,3-bis-(O-geranylgeranyl)-sn-glycerol synthase
MLQNVYFSLWFMLPAAIANASPIFSAHLPYLKRWNAPIDNGRTFRGKAIFGTHKTWRGLLGGIIVATVVFWLQQQFGGHLGFIRHSPDAAAYLTLPIFILGPLFGFGALLGDAVESFIKRQRDIPSGKSWFPFDQLDYIIGGLLVSLPFITLPFAVYIWILVLWMVIHLIASYVGFLVGLKDEPI